jgi:hypothetical protein
MKYIAHPANVILYSFLLAGFNPGGAMESMVRGPETFKNALKPRTIDDNIFNNIVNVEFEQPSSPLNREQHP